MFNSSSVSNIFKQSEIGQWAADSISGTQANKWRIFNRTLVTSIECTDSFIKVCFLMLELIMEYISKTRYECALRTIPAADVGTNTQGFILQLILFFPINVSCQYKKMQCKTRMMNIFFETFHY